MRKENKKWSKRKKITLSILLFIGLCILSFPFALNFYLKSKLPEFINSQTAYDIQMHDFNFDLLHGELHAKKLIITTKNPKDTTVTQLSGTISELIVKDFGVINALFFKKYKAELIALHDPILEIRSSVNTKINGTKNKTPNLFITDLKIINGEIKATDIHDKIFFNGNKINIELTDIHLDNSNKSSFPIAFKEIKIHTENAVIPINAEYQLLARKIDTKNKEVQIENLQLLPNEILLHHSSKSVISLNTQHVTAENLSINKDSLTAESLTIEHPILAITASQNRSKADKPGEQFNFSIHLNKISLNDGQFVSKTKNQIKIASVEKLNGTFSNFKVNKSTLKNAVPFHVDHYDLALSQVFVPISNSQNLAIDRLKSTNYNATLEALQLSSSGADPNKDTWTGSVRKLILKQVKPNVTQKITQLKINGIELDGANVQLIPKRSKSKVKAEYQSPKIELALHQLLLKDSRFEQRNSKGQRDFSIGNINANFEDVKYNATTFRSKIPFTIKKQHIKGENIFIDAGKYYTVNIKKLQNNGKTSTINNLDFKSKYSRKAFSKIIAQQEDLYDISAKQIQINDRQSLLEEHQQIYLDNVTLDGVRCGIYHDLAPPEDKSVRSMFNEKLRSIKIPLFVQNIDIKNSYISYEEDASTNNKPGKLFLDQFSAKIKNVGNAKIKGTPSMVIVDSRFNFFGTAPTKALWTFDVLNQMDEYKISGSVDQLSANEVNLFVRPYLNITLDGKINSLRFNYFGNKNWIKGDFFLNHNDIYVNFLNKKGDKRRFLNKAVNILVRSDAKNGGKTVKIEKKRDADRSFFNMLWKGIMEGLKKTLL